MSIARINQYYKELEDIYMFSGATNETSIRRVTANLISDYAKEKHLMLIDEVKLPHLPKVPDGALQDTYKFNYGYWEAKDLKDDLEKEIKHKINIGYPTENLLIEDTKVAVLIRGDLREYCDMKDAKALDKFLTKFVSFVRQDTLDFRAALEQFAKDTPQIVRVLEEMIAEQVKTNAIFKQKRQGFFELCQSVINPTVTFANVDEMLIQHILTEEIFFSVMSERQFHEDNNISRTLTDIEKTFFVKDTKREVLAKLEPYYEAVRLRATAVRTHEDKQDFLKAIYESFYKAYNPASADRLGIVYTPSEVVRFMIEATEYLLEKHFDKTLADKGVEILDPATGTGTFITDLIKHLPTNMLAYKYENEIHANEVAILPYYIANLNIEYIYKQKMGGKYAEFKNLCFVDTLDNTDALKYAGKQNDMFGDLAENALRIKAQNDRKISVIIGNPPYNANQQNENDNNKNREYATLDKRIKETFVKQSTAQKTKVYDMYSRFIRWASDRIDSDGMISFITNNSFIDSATFDGFRKVVAKEFNEIYIINLKGNAYTSGERRRQEKGNIFDDKIKVGVAIYFLIKNKKLQGCKIYYNEVDDYLESQDKINYLKDNSFKKLDFERIKPDIKGNWINLADSDFDTLIPIYSKEKSKEVIFEFASLGVSTNRDEWVYDFNEQNLTDKIQYFIQQYNRFVDTNNDSWQTNIKWSESLKNYFQKKQKITFDKNLIVKANYRPFVAQYYYAEKLLSDRLTQNHYDIFEKDLKENFYIAQIGDITLKPFSVLAGKYVPSLNYLSPASGCRLFPFYRYEAGKQVENITDWALGQFVGKYKDKTIGKEDIFHYVYAVLHSPAYREKYAQNLKRDFPRLPLYDDFWKYAEAGKELMALHLWEGGDGSVEGREGSVEERDGSMEGRNLHSLSSHLSSLSSLPSSPSSLLPSLEVKHHTIESMLPKRKASPTYEAEQAELIKNYVPEVKLKVKDDIIEIDSLTAIVGVPALAYQYKLGNRSAIEWVLDQYKPYKSSDQTIQANFNNYRFSDYKQEVIDLLLRVIYVSVRTYHLTRDI